MTLDLDRLGAILTLAVLASCGQDQHAWQPDHYLRDTGGNVPIRLLHFEAEDLLIIGMYDGPDRYTIMRRGDAKSPWVVVERDWPEDLR